MGNTLVCVWLAVMASSARDDDDINNNNDDGSSSSNNNNRNNKKQTHRYPITFPGIDEPISVIDSRIGRIQPSTMVIHFCFPLLFNNTSPFTLLQNQNQNLLSQKQPILYENSKHKSAIK